MIFRLPMSGIVCCAVFGIWSCDRSMDGDDLSPAPPGPREVAVRGPGAEHPAVRPLAHGEKIPDAVLFNQDGETITLSSYRGSVLVLTFIYTRCNMPSMCPLVTAKFKELQSDLAKRKIDGARFLTVSFDGGYDKPEALKEFARRYKADFATWDFAGGKPEDVGPLAKAFNIYYRQSQEGIFDHNIIVAIVDRKGVFRDDFFGADWDVEEAASVIAALAEERSKEQ